MGISFNTIKKGINFVLKSSQNEVSKVKLSVFEGFESASAKKLENAFAQKTPFKSEVPYVQNPFAPRVGSVEKSLNFANHSFLKNNNF